MDRQLKKRFEIAQLIAEDFSGLLTEDKKNTLDVWRKESEANEKEYQNLFIDLAVNRNEYAVGKYRTEQAWGRFTDSFQRKFSFKKVLYPLAAMLVLGFGVALFRMSGFISKDSSSVNPTISVLKAEPVLVLSNGNRLSVGDSVSFSANERYSTIRVKDNTVFYSGMDSIIGQDEENTLIIPQGGEYKVVLEDGTRVWLNAKTRFRYPVAFAGQIRKVYLEGEAFFDVAGNPEKPFVVSTNGGVDIRVLGTRFNVSAYNDEEAVITTLNQGSVEVSASSGRYSIRPDEQLVFHKESASFTHRKVDADIYSSWTAGKLVFEEMPLEGVMRLLQRYYDMEVFYLNDAIRHMKFSGEVEKYTTFGKIVSMLEEVSGLDFKIRNNCVTVGFR